jgi:cell fate regulator YaaT (PSP1 superfamily)
MNERLEPPDATGPREVGVQFKTAGKVYRFDAGTFDLRTNDRVVVQTERGTALGNVVVPPQPRQSTEGSSLPRVVKKADARDLSREDANMRHEREAERFCVDRIRARQLGMKLVKAEYLFDGNKAVFYFAAEDRVDYRELVRDLAQRLQVRVEMKQIGARDETKVTGGLGPCGRELCCSSWLREFAAISVKMAKEQDLALNHSRLAGMCGRLKCCLRYEYETYLALKYDLPRVGTRVESVKGDGEVVSQNILKQTVVIRRAEDGDEVEAGLEDLVVPRADA